MFTGLVFRPARACSSDCRRAQIEPKHLHGQHASLRILGRVVRDQGQAGAGRLAQPSSGRPTRQRVLEQHECWWMTSPLCYRVVDTQESSECSSAEVTSRCVARCNTDGYGTNAEGRQCVNLINRLYRGSWSRRRASASLRSLEPVLITASRNCCCRTRLRQRGRI